MRDRVHPHAASSGQLGRLPRTRDRGAAHSFVDPRVSPLTNCFWRAKKTISVGIATRMEPAAIRLLFVKNSPWRLFRADVIGYFAPVFMRIRAQKKSL